MTPMLEKMAQAFWASRESRMPRFTQMSWEAGTPQCRAAVLHDLRAALEAIREPSAAMIVNGREAILPISYGANAPVSGPAVAGVWRDMIDAILNEKPEP